MSSTPKTVYRGHRASLENHLRALMPHWGDQPLAITSQDLASNGSFVNYVRHHRLLDPRTGQPVELVEKSVRKLAFIGSQEARLHRSTHFRHPACLGVIETPFASLIFTEFVHGKPPRMHAIARQMAAAIAELESHSHRYLATQPPSRQPLLWSMDFFRPWFLLRPRFNFARCLPGLQRLGREDARFAGLAGRFDSFVPLLRQPYGLSALCVPTNRAISLPAPGNA